MIILNGPGHDRNRRCAPWSNTADNQSAESLTSGNNASGRRVSFFIFFSGLKNILVALDTTGVTRCQFHFQFELFNAQ
jgi:hypothetical protein